MKREKNTFKNNLQLGLLSGLLAACVPTCEESFYQSSTPGTQDPPTQEEDDVSLIGPALYLDTNRNGVCDRFDTLTVFFSDEVELISGATGVSVDDLFNLTSDTTGLGYSLGNDFFGEGPTWHFGDGPGDTHDDSITIVLGYDPYIKGRQVHGTGADSLFPTGIELAQSPSLHLAGYSVFPSIEADAVITGAAPKDIAPGMVVGLPALATLKIHSIAMADLDGDGDQDLACGLEYGQMAGEVAFLCNNGQRPPGFALGGPLLSTGMGSGFLRVIGQLECADFDGDGDQDLLALGPVTVLEPLWLNDGSGLFSAASGKAMAGSRADGCAVGDVDGDGDLDVVMVSEQNEVLSLFENDGEDLFETLPVTWKISGVRDVALTDFNLDGLLDMIVGGSVASANRIWTNDGGAVSMGFATVPTTSYLSYPVDNLFVADVNRDGAVDFATSSDDAGQLARVLYNDGQGGLASIEFIDPTDLPNEGTLMAMADFDADGSVDIARTSCSQGDLELVSAFAAVPLASSLVAEAGSALVAGDLDGDGDLDLVLAGCEGGVFPISNSLSGVFGWLTLRDEEQELSGSTRDVHLVDVDGDGDLDLVSRNADPVHSNDGLGTFTPTAQSFSAQGASDLAVGDLDGDSDPDLVMAWNATSPVAVGVSFLLNDGGLFGPSSNDLVDMEGVVRVELADLNHDGSLDLYCVDGAGLGDYILTNDGTGRFTFSSSTATGGLVVASRFADMDQDGDLDIVRCVQGVGVSVLDNDGAGNFSVGYQVGQQAGALCLADVDADGDTDMVLSVGSAQRVLFNQGGGSGYSLGVNFGTSFVQDIEAEDMDGDGDLDLVMASSSSQEPLWLNDGQGNFSSAYESLPGSCADLDLGDIDADGDVDVVLSTQYLGGALVVRSE